MHLCFLTLEYPTRPPWGGIATYIRELTHVLIELGHQCTVICVLPGSEGEVEQDDGVEVHFVPSVRIRMRRVLRLLARLPGLQRAQDLAEAWSYVEASVAAWRALQKVHRQQPVDLVEIQDWGGVGLWTLLRKYALKGHGRQPRFVLRGQGHMMNRLRGGRVAGMGDVAQHWFERFCAQRVDFVLPNAAHLAQEMLVDFDLAPHRIGYLHYGINTNFPLPERDIARRRLALEEHHVLITYAGRLESFKRVTVLFDAMRPVHQAFPNVRLALLGRLTDAHIQDQYHRFMLEAPFWAWHPGGISHTEVAAVMCATDIFAYPSTHEPFSRAMLEAMAHGLPIVASRSGCALEMVEEGVTGLLFEPGNAQAMAEALLSLCRDPARRRAMGQRARERAIACFEIRDRAAEQMRLYERLVAGESLRSFSLASTQSVTHTFTQGL